MEIKLYTVSSAPHWHCGRTTRETTYNTIGALIPALVLSVAFFGAGALRVVALSCFAAMLAEAACQHVMKRKITLCDGSAVLTGLLFAFLMPPSSPWWLVVLGSVIAIVIGKQVFGGIGANPIPAALVGWAIIKISWTGLMDFDQAMLDSHLTYPLNTLKFFGAGAIGEYNYAGLLAGKQLGPLGGVHVLALLAGGVYLIARGYVKPHIPAAFLAGVLVTALVFNMADGGKYADPVFHLLTGSVVLCAFFIATNSSSAPVNPIAMVLFGALAGALVIVIRAWGIYPDGTPFAVMLACLCTPLIDRIKPRVWGRV
jgi:electron transport complex protein RnfD